MGRGARIIRTGGRIAVSIRFNNARRHAWETADSAIVIRSQEMAPNGPAEIGVDLSRKAQGRALGPKTGRRRCRFVDRGGQEGSGQ